MLEINTVDDMIEYIESIIENTHILRSDVLKIIMDNSDKWSLAIKALLIKKSEAYISVSYLLEKLNYCKDNPEKPFMILDIEGITIYMILLNRPSDKKFINHLDSYKF